MSTPTITEFLDARIAEDEYAAQLTYATAFVGRIEGSGSRYDLALRMTPARVLAECAAKRAIIQLHGEASRNGYDNATAYLGDALYALASVYRMHPDYRQEWAL